MLLQGRSECTRVLDELTIGMVASADPERGVPWIGTCTGKQARDERSIPGTGSHEDVVAPTPLFESNAKELVHTSLQGITPP